ncbi:MAG: hypothetical protein Q4G65_01305 [bacterium]|nr:hypothetical protein [bacterium]
MKVVKWWALLGGLAAAIPVSAAEWTWYGAANDCNYGGLVTKSTNWKDASGAAGVPAKGDTVRIPANSGTKVSTNNQSNQNSWGDTYVTGNSFNQAIICLLGGHKIHFYKNVTGTAGLCLEGDGEVEVVSTSGVDINFQKSFTIKGSGLPTFVKDGAWKLTCFYQSGSREYKFPTTKIRKGVLNITTKTAMSGNTFIFDGDETSQRLDYTTKDSSTIHDVDLVLNNGLISESADVNNTGHGISATYAAQLVLGGTPKANPMRFTGTFYTQAGLTWKPSSPDYVFECAKAVSATKGRMVVEKGTLRLVEGASFTSLSELAVSGGAKVQVATASGADFHADVLTLSDATAALDLAEGVLLEFTGATLAGAALPPGTYAAEPGVGERQAAWIAGAGKVVVLTGPANSATWTGAGVDANMATDANWTGGTAPDFTAGDLLATFATGGASAALAANETAAFDGLVLDGGFGGNAFAFTAGTGASASLGKNGLALADAAAATTWTMGWPLVLSENQVWNVGANNTLRLTGGFSGEKALEINSAGTVEIAAPSTQTGGLTLNTGTFNITDGTGLGPAGRTVQVNHNAVKLAFSGTTQVDAPLKSGTFVNTTPAVPFISLAKDATATFNGLVSWLSNGRIELAQNAVATFKGGLSTTLSAVYGHVYTYGSGTIVVSGTPLNVGWGLYVVSSSTATWDLRVANNKIAPRWAEFQGNGKILMTAENALATGQKIYMNQGTLDLCGKNQRLDTLATSANKPVIRTDEPATLTMGCSATQDSEDFNGTNRLVRAIFQGPVSLVKQGSLPFVIAAESPASGTVTVKQGVLTFTAAGLWPNCSGVNVTGGKLKIQNAVPFNEETVWTVDGGILELDFDGTIPCERIQRAGRWLRGGVYGAMGSGAAHEVDWIVGTGRLASPERGTTILFR